ELMNELYGLISMSLGDDIHIDMAIDDDLWVVSVDPGQLENAILNLAINARDAMPDGGVLAFRAQNRTVDAEDEDEGEHGGPAPGQYVRLVVQDGGCGMAPEVLRKAFDPFFTTKDIGKGSGLGLSMVYGFVNQSGGHVKVASEEGVGTSVTMLLPRDERTPEAAEAPVRYDIAAGAGEHVLLVEDDGEVRQLTAHMLTGLGYRVAEAVDAESAREQIERQLPDLILADVGLGGEINGPALVAEIDARYPEVRVLFVTAYSDAAARAAGVDTERFAILFKPFRMEGLARAVRDALENRGPAPDASDRA
ncbi:MAG: response regulator, partial [Proteobacteria bacterium]|nr:response regulator [Pseudomonadota bacterium]